MHSDHEMFERGVSQSRKIKLTFLSDQPFHELVRQCGPLYYSRGKAEVDGSDCYYLWDFEADEGYNFIALPPGQIVSMELTTDSFSIDEVSNLNKKPGRSTRGLDTVSGE